MGVFVFRDGGVHWEPAVDVSRLAIGGMLTAVAALLVLRSVVKAMFGGR